MAEETAAGITRPRRRGRPRTDEKGGEELREAVISAATGVYAKHGYHRTTVEQILKAANISRPTFYKLFKDRYEVIDIVVARANDVLRTKVAEAIVGIDGAMSMIKAGVNAYIDWCREIGPLVGPIYSEINDPESPASKHRSRVIDDFISVFNIQSTILSVPQLDPLMYDTLLRTSEHAISSAFWPKRLSDKEIERRRAITLRIMLAALATPEMFEDIPPLETVTQ